MSFELNSINPHILSLNEGTYGGQFLEYFSIFTDLLQGSCSVETYSYGSSAFLLENNNN